MKTNYHHQELASGRWFKLSLIEQLANIGSEVERTTTITLLTKSGENTFTNLPTRRN